MAKSKNARGKKPEVEPEVELHGLGFSIEKELEKLANQHGIDGFQYVDKFQAYRAYKDGVQVDWLPLLDLAVTLGEHTGDLNPRAPKVQRPIKKIFKLKQYI